MRPLPIPEDVAALASEFALWRQQRPHLRAQVPDELMQRAVALTRTHSIHVVARGIKFDRRRLLAAAARSARGKEAAASKPQAAPAPVRLLPVKLAAAATMSGTVVEIVTDGSTPA
jgi:hypothetical protein